MATLAPDTIGPSERQDIPKDEEHQSVANNPEPAVIPYTAFRPWTKRLLTLLVGVAGLFSPLSANIYFPSLLVLSESLDVSLNLINFTITSYIIVQAIAPTLFGDLADTFGRRPIYLLTFSIYIFANLGLALQDSYAALLVLRMVQSLGCSATIAIGYGVVFDVAVPAERGRMLGLSMIAANLGTCLGPLFGGLLARNVGWRWSFWLLMILGGVFLAILVLMLPETGRSVVGNGNIEAPWWDRPLLANLFCWTERQDEHSQDSSNPGKKKPAVPNPLRSLQIVFHRDVGLVLWMSAINYTVYYVVQASLPLILEEVYGFDEQQVGLSYLSISGGVVLGGYLNGRMMDYNYRTTAKSIGFKIDRVSGDDLSFFPIERARSRMAYYLIGICTGMLLGYGWMLDASTHVSVTLIFEFLFGFVTTCIVQTFNTLLVDINSNTPSAAAASGNLTRCALSAGGVAAMQPLLDRMGRGWYFTLLGLVSGVSGVLVVAGIRWKGMKWRQRRLGVDVSCEAAGLESSNCEKESA